MPPVNVGDPPMVQVAVKVPEPVEDPEDPEQRPDSTWMKVFKVKLSDAPQNPNEMQDLLQDLLSGNVIVPEDVAEIETEWELLEGGKDPKEKMNEEPIDEDNDKTIIRRYEFYEYAGLYDDEHEPLSQWEEFGNPDDPALDVFDNDGNKIFTGERGGFIAANMVAAVLNPIPEPSSIGLVLVGAVLMTFGRRS